MEFTQENFVTVLSDFENHLLSLNINNGCNISLTIQFHGGRGSVNVQCYNESENSSNDLRFHAIIQFDQTGVSYTSALYDACPSNKSWNPSFIKEWISRQKEIINKIGNMEKKKNFTYIEFLIWGRLQSNETDLSFAIFVNQNESRNATDQNRLPCRYTHQMIITTISGFIIQFSDLVIPSPLNDTTSVIEKMKKKFFNDTRSSDSCSTLFGNPSTAMKKNQTKPEDGGTTPLMNSSTAMKKNQTKPKGRSTTPFMNSSEATSINPKKNDESLPPLFIFLITLVVLILIVISVVCFILYYQRRSGYRLTAVS